MRNESPLAGVVLSPEDRAALVVFWNFYEPVAEAISREVLTLAFRRPAWKTIVESTTGDHTAERTSENIALQRAAILDGCWGPYLDELRSQGIAFARAGLPYDAWFELLSDFRTVVRAKLADIARTGEHGLNTAISASNGLHLIVDLMIQTVGTAYLDESAARLSSVESRYRAMFDNSPTPMWLFDHDTLRFVDVNEAAIRQYGYSRDEFLTMTLADI